jgi:hypothetical protein
MKLSAIGKLLSCKFLYRKDDVDPDVTMVMGSDMMSDVLAFAKPGALLVTGLTNSQSVRTADIADAVGIVYVRGKMPDAQTVRLGGELSITLMSTRMNMVETCAALQAAGLIGIC